MFPGYEDLEDMPELTAEGYSREIENMKTHARGFGELLELKVALHHVRRLPADDLNSFVYIYDFYDEDEVRAILQLAIDSDWSEVPRWVEYVDQEIEFTDVPAYEWFPARRRMMESD
ncbi:MAG: hypothetical protein R3A79_02150 [Nannocystaceae bacterium]